MMTERSDTLTQHLQSGITTTCRAWAIERRDGVRFGFTDHDLSFSFEGFDFAANSGLSARALEQSTGLSVDNTEALGALSDTRIREDEIEAGRFDRAQVWCWLVNWADHSERALLFRGTIGELRRAGGAFQAELRGLTEALNRPMGRVYQKPCSAVLGDKSCRFNVNSPGYFTAQPVGEHDEARRFFWPGLTQFAPNWFQRGQFHVTSGVGAGLSGIIKSDEIENGARVVTLWEPIRAELAPGDMVRLEAGCDRRAATCRVKFQNFVNYQGFPDIPGEDWITTFPKSSGAHTGGSLR